MIKRAGQHRERGGGVGGGRRLRLQRIAGLQPRHHHLDGDHRVVDEKAERDDERPERDALQAEMSVTIPWSTKVDREHERYGQGDDDPALTPRLRKLAENDDDRLEGPRGSCLFPLRPRAGPRRRLTLSRWETLRQASGRSAVGCRRTVRLLLPC